MDKTERLFSVMDALRRHRRPVTASALAEEQGVSVRTLYRDIQTLIGLGAPIDGEAGVGYMLRPGFFLPPLMFSAEELEALVLGARWVEQRPDDALAGAARNALAKIATASPDDLRDRIGNTGLCKTCGGSNEPCCDGNSCRDGGCCVSGTRAAKIAATSAQSAAPTHTQPKPPHPSRACPTNGPPATPKYSANEL